MWRKLAQEDTGQTRSSKEAVGHWCKGVRWQQKRGSSDNHEGRMESRKGRRRWFDKHDGPLIKVVHLRHHLNKNKNYTKGAKNIVNTYKKKEYCQYLPPKKVFPIPAPKKRLLPNSSFISHTILRDAKFFFETSNLNNFSLKILSK